MAERDERERFELAEEEDRGDVEGHLLAADRDADEDEGDVEAHLFTAERPSAERPSAERPSAE